MVNRHNQKTKTEQGGEPPSLDDSWWEAVLAEERENNPSSSGELNTNYESKTNLPSLEPPDEKGETLDWEYTLNLYQQDQAITLLVTGYNKGGLLVNGENLQGFVPISHLVDLPGNISLKEQENLLAAYVNHQLKLKVIECDQQRGRVVFSERAALADPGVRNTLFSKLQPGECVCGMVTNVTEFGAFIDLGGIEGLVHVSEISWGRVRHPGDVVKVGDKVRVSIINVDPDRARVALSLKRLCPNPWETAESRYFPGQITEAVITSIVPYGAFARLEEGLDGLIHVTEVSQPEISEDPLKTLSEGQRVQVRVLHVDATKQRLGLSLQLAP
jgi:small subunit ribosomal protein S1